MTEKINNIKKHLKRNYLFWKYKRNKGSGKLLIQKESDRQLGLTTMMIEDCLKNDYWLYVPTMKDRYNLSNDIAKTLCPLDNLQGKKDLNIIVDNHCSFEDVRKLLNKKGYGRVNIINGFVYEPLAK